MPTRSLPTLRAAGMRVEIDLRNEKINYKVREHSLAHVPLILAVGRRDMESQTVAVRRLGSEKQEVLELGAAVTTLSDGGPAALLGRPRSRLPAPMRGFNERRRKP